MTDFHYRKNVRSMSLTDAIRHSCGQPFLKKLT